MEEEPKQISLPIYFLPKFIFLLVVLAAIFILSSCLPVGNYDIRGNLDDVMTAANGDACDTGIIPFEGVPSRGRYARINNNQIKYDGENKVRSSSINFSSYEKWAGTFFNADTIRDTRYHDDEAQVTFEAIRKQ